MIALCLVCFSGMQAQSFDKGTKVVALGIGLGSSRGGFGFTSTMPGFSLQFEQGVWEAGGSGIVSLGGYLGYKSFSDKYDFGSITSTSKWNYTIVGIRSAYHFTGLGIDNIDLYGGMMLSYNILNYKYTDNTGYSGSVGDVGSTAGLTIYAGGRYYFNESIGVYAELGYGVAYLNLGGVIRF